MTLVSGGGGGGAGIASPENATLLQTGGGRGGGVQIGAGGTPWIGAVMGNHPYGVLDVTDDVDPIAFAGAMVGVVAEIRACHRTPGRVVALRVGGGGGSGWETHLEWNLSNSEARADERVPNGMNTGYEFQFALGQGVKPTRKAEGAEESMVTGALQDSAEDSGSPDYAAINAVFSCASKLASALCARAAYTDPTTLRLIEDGTFRSYASCNCPVSNLYLEEHLPDAPSWSLIRRACTFGQSDGPETPSSSLGDHPGEHPLPPRLVPDGARL